MVQHMFHHFLRWPLLIRILSIAVIVMLTFGVAIHLVEPESYPTLFDGIWWAIITTSTVGYGDFYPSTVEGRLIAITLIFLGVGFLTTYFVTLATATVTTQNAIIEGKAIYKGHDHIVIIGWNARTKDVINQLKVLDAQQEVTLIDETLEKNPYTDHRIHFIRGKAFQDSILEKANVSGAQKILITADQNKNELYADMNSILTLIAVKGINPNIYTVVEILTSDQIANAERAGADEVIQTNKQSSYVMMNSLISQGMSTTILKLLNYLRGNHLMMLPVTESWENKTFEELSSILLKEKIILLGVKTEGSTTVNPPLHTKIQLHDQLLVISN